LACLVAVVAAWSKEDQEIFRLRNEVEESEGEGVTFYDFLDVKPSASQDEINKAYRKRSRVLHPDKVKQQFIADKSTGKDKAAKSKGTNKKGVHVSKGPSQSEIKATTNAASDRFARLGIVTNILRGSGRERYDHFLANGFPKWKGTGYYYARFRPGLGSVIIGLFIFIGGGGHWIILYVNWKRYQDQISRYINYARKSAWGDALSIPGVGGTATPPTPVADGEADPMQPMNRRQRRMQEKDAKKEKVDKKTKKPAKISPVPTPPSESTGPKRRVVTENGRTLVVDSAGNVYLEQPDADGETQEYLLDLDHVKAPTVRDTALCRLPIWAYNQTVGRFLNKPPVEEDFDEEEDGEPVEDTEEVEDFEVLEKVKSTAPNGNGKAVRRAKKSARGR